MLRAPKVPPLSLVALLFAAFSAGCEGPGGEADGPAACVPGAQVACACAGGGSGVQLCNGSGNGLGACTGCLDAFATEGDVVEADVGDSDPGDPPDVGPDDAQMHEVSKPGPGDGFGTCDSEGPDASDCSPSVAFVSPGAGAVLCGLVTVEVAASAPWGLAAVELFVDGTLTAIDLAPPFAFVVDAMLLAPGVHELRARVRDLAGQVSEASIAVTTEQAACDSPPTVSFEAQHPSSAVSGLTLLSADVSDDVGVVKVRFFVDNALLSETHALPFEALWDTTTVPEGVYSVKAIAHDTADQTGTAQVTVTVDNTAPVLAVPSPIAGAIYGDFATLEATVDDKLGVAQVEVWVEGDLWQSFEEGPVSVTLTEAELGAGWHGLEVRAVDVAGNETTVSLKFMLGACEGEACSSETEAIVPAGPFWMGCNSNLENVCGSKTEPQHEVHVPTFYMDRHEVTVEEYAQCVAAGDCSLEEAVVTEGLCNGPYMGPAWVLEDGSGLPMNCLTWDEANAYCGWKGKRLCTEAEWEKAARGGCDVFPDGVCKEQMPPYPWGAAEPTCDLAVFHDGGDANGCGTGRTWPPGSKPLGASVYGVHDLAGNVAEWVADKGAVSYTSTPVDGTAYEGDWPNTRVCRGGYFTNWDTWRLQSSIRFSYWPGVRYEWLGARCCRSADADEP